ncbi:MAG: FAD-binding oxidoreductase, partial [Chloroflexi bacterium]|nr:FAD-binding oxidoreductase [Chloroflexota bacterium]
QTFLPRGFFPPVVPGTKYVTVGGALASDIHGKNHHVAGSWSNHVRRVELLLASGETVRCDSDQNAPLFRATAGGQGLTGIILTMEVRLDRLEGFAGANPDARRGSFGPVGDSTASPQIEMESVRVGGLDEFFSVSSESSGWPFTVGWIDGIAGGPRLGRGVFMRGRFTRREGNRPALRSYRRSRVSGRMLEFNWLLNGLTVRAFNEVYFRRRPARAERRTVDPERFFFPLDAIADWNRMYGKRGFLQYQFVVPKDGVRERVRAVLSQIVAAHLPAFLGVIKEFGPTANGGLSFPIEGTTVALDFPNLGPRLMQHLVRLDSVVAEAGGRVYLAKDARVGPEAFRQMYPEWASWKQIRDKADPSGVFTSELARRLQLAGH